METYFIDWEISKKDGRVFKWVNSIIESDASPEEVFNAARDELKEEFKDGAHFRAKTFNKI